MAKGTMAYSEIRDRLFEDLISGELSPGSRLTVASLAKKYGVGTMPIRAALQELRGRGLITAEPNHTARVRGMSPELIDNIYDLRSAIWDMLLPRCVRFITNADIEELEKIQDRMDAATERGDEAEARVQNAAFHRLIYSIARNPEAYEVMDRNWVLINCLRTVYGYGTKRLTRVNGMRRKLISALRARDAEAALKLIHDSAEESRQSLIKSVNGEN